MPVDESQDEHAIALLARAFRDNPLDIAVIGGSAGRRLGSVRWGMRSTVAAARRCPSAVLLGAWEDPAEPAPSIRRERGKPIGYLLGLPSRALPLPPPPLLPHLRATWGQGFRALRRWGEVFRVLERAQPREPHWYLSLLGVDPPRQGRGVGRRLLEAWLSSIDPDGLPSYLETDRESNVAFYARAGFEVVTRLEILDTPVWCMRRPAGSPRGERT
jgi:ribosomal protein S18 acetylase RimI-like enzyme